MQNEFHIKETNIEYNKILNEQYTESRSHDLAFGPVFCRYPQRLTFLQSLASDAICKHSMQNNLHDDRFNF